MKTKLGSLIVALLATSTFAIAAPNTLSPAEKSEGWKLIFDGTSLSGWRGYSSEKPGAGWKVADGAVTLDGSNAGDLVSLEEFGDFELSLEWKVSEAANSGIVYRVGLGDAATYNTGPEYQILDNIKGEDRKRADHQAASLYDLIAPPADYSKPIGEWNEARIIVKGWKVQHWLNGKKTVDVDLGSADGRAMIAASKFKAWPKFATLLKGRIALQDHGHVVSYRNIKVRAVK